METELLVTPAQTKYIRDLIYFNFQGYFATKQNWKGKESFDVFVGFITNFFIEGKFGYTSEFQITKEQASNFIKQLQSGVVKAKYEHATHNQIAA